MGKWLQEWGERPKRRVRPFWWPPSLILRQGTSILYLAALSGWRKMPRWLVRYGFRCLPGAAGARGMGCIGFPAHPVWEVTTACNLKCSHCHVSGTKGEELDTDEGKSLLDQLAGVREFRMMAFTGGEPLLRGDLFEMLAYSQALGFSNTIATNATLIDHETARRLRSYGVVIAAVSLDGDRETHDQLRGSPGAFQAAIEGMKALRRAGIVLHVNITAMQSNMDQIESLIELADGLGAGIVLVYQLIPIGRGKRIREAALSRKDNERLTHIMARAQRSAQAVLEPVAGPQYWSYLLHKSGIRSGPLLGLAETVFHGCSAGRGFVYIKPDGEVLPCPFIEESCGNVRDTPFSTIWKSSPVLQDLREREERLKGACGECVYRSLCGGCRGRAWTSTGDYLAEDPSCFITKYERGSAMKHRASLIELIEPIQREMEGVESIIHSALQEVDEPLLSVLRRSIRGGKRIRPAMVILIGRMLGSPDGPLLDLAAAIEMIHAATLIHDDLLDRSPLRRGSETHHMFWPLNATILAGDFLLSKAVSLLAGLGQPRILNVVAESLCGMCSGEISQTFGQKHDKEDYYRIIDAKTASLCAAATKSAGILSANEHQIEALRLYGRELGLAFQVVDDVLDLLPYEADFDKPVESDIRQGLITLPAILYLENGGNEALINAVISGNADENDLQSAIKAVRSSGAIEAALGEARVHAGRAKEALDLLPGCVDREILLSLAEYVVDRRS